MVGPERLDEVLDQALEDTFPASDPLPPYGGFEEPRDSAA